MVIQWDTNEDIMRFFTDYNQKLVDIPIKRDENCNASIGIDLYAHGKDLPRIMNTAF